MRPGSVIVDLAAESGGNCELTEPGERDRRERRHDRRSRRTCPSTMPTHASQLLSRNVASLVGLLVRDGELVLDWDDEIVAGVLRHAEGGGDVSHTATLVTELTVLVLAIFLGFEVISKVPTMLHTPLMSGTNAIHGIVIVGAIIVAGSLAAGRTDPRRRVRRGRACVGERRRRVRRHRPDARDVQEEADGEAEGRLMGTNARQPALPRHDRVLRARAALPVVAGDSAARQLDRRGRHDGRDRRDAGQVRRAHHLGDARRGGDRRRVRRSSARAA